MPSASATSSECAHVSIIRAVAIDVALIGGPNQAIFSPSGTPRSASASAVRLARQRNNSSSDGNATRRCASASTNPAGSCAACLRSAPNPSGDVTAMTATSSVQRRWAIWCAMVHPCAGVGNDHWSGPSGATHDSSWAPSASRSARTSFRRSFISFSQSERRALRPTCRGVWFGAWCRRRGSLRGQVRA